jgi:tRNA(fMet)-specific endonuclease VapC
VTRYLLDTNIVSALFRDPGGPVDRALRARKEDEIGTSLIVRGEILFGLRKNDSLRGVREFQMLLETIVVWPLEKPTEDCYAKLRVAMERSGEQVGPNDLWIAAQALALNAVVVTDDRIFQRLPDVKVENWLRESSPNRE